jgi:hypothetical protein
VSNEGYFTLETERVFPPYLAYNWNGVTEMTHHALLPGALEAVQVWSKSITNEGHFTSEADTVYRPNVASRSSGVTEN